MKILFCTKFDLFSKKNKKGGDYSNVKLLEHLSSFSDVTIGVSKVGSSNKNFPNFNWLGIKSMYFSWQVPLCFFCNLSLKESDFNFDYIIGIKGTILQSFFISRKFNIPLVLVARDMEEIPVFSFDSGKSLLRGIVKNLLLGRLWKKAYESAGCVITSSHFLGNLFYSNYKIKENIVLYPLIARDLKNLKISIIRDRPIGMVSGTQYKGEAIFYKLAEMMPDQKFIVFNSCFKGLAPNNVTLYGYSSKEQIFSSISLLLIPSLVKESFGRVALESLSFGVPCLSHDIGGLQEALEPKILRVELKNLEQWKEKIEKVLSGDPRYLEAYDEELLKLNKKFGNEVHCARVKSVFIK